MATDAFREICPHPVQQLQCSVSTAGWLVWYVDIQVGARLLVFWQDLIAVRFTRLSNVVNIVGFQFAIDRFIEYLVFTFLNHIGSQILRF